MTRSTLCLLACLLAGATPATAQETAFAPDGILRGAVVDSATGQPVGYALIVWVEKDQRVFATESGRFVVSGVGGGKITLRVQQIGYRAVTLGLEIETRATPGVASALLVRLARHALVLPEIIVQGDVCSGVEALGAESEGGTILDEAFTNAERLLALQNSYPFRVAFQRVTTHFDQSYRRVAGWVDTVRYDSRKSEGYRTGKVLERPSGVGGRELANYFTPADLANPEFTKSHCFWYAGTDSLQDFPGYRISFAPTRNIKSVDWAGSLLIDATSMTLLQSTARLVNLKGKNTIFGSAECTVFYKQLAPTLAHEFQARCVSQHRSVPPRSVVERWLLSEFSFIGKSPVDSTPP